MKEVNQNYICENELAKFYLNSLSDEESITGKITVTKNGEIKGELPYLSESFFYALLKNDPQLGNYRELPKLFVQLCKNGHYFYLDLPTVSWTKKSDPLKQDFCTEQKSLDTWQDDPTLGNPQSVWRVVGVKAALFFTKNEVFPKEIKIESILWNLQNFRKWIGAFIQNPKILLDNDKQQQLRKIFGYEEDSNHIFITCVSSNKTYDTNWGRIEIHKSYNDNGWSLQQTEAKVETSAFLIMKPKTSFALHESAELYSGVEAFFRTFISRDKEHQLPYPEVSISGNRSALLIIPRVEMEMSVSYSSHPLKGDYLLPFERIKNDFGNYLETYLKNFKEFQSAYSIYAKDVCKCEYTEEAFFSLVTSLETLLRKAFKDSGKNPEHEKRRPLIEEQITQAVNSLEMLTKEEKEPFIQKASDWGKDPSVKNRLTSALKELGCGLDEDDIKKYVKELYGEGGIRHKLAHEATCFKSFNKGENSSVFLRLFQALFTTRIVIYMLIMKSIGLNKGQIVWSLERSSEFSFERDNDILNLSPFSKMLKNLLYKTANYELEKLEKGDYDTDLSKEELDRSKKCLLDIKDRYSVYFWRSNISDLTPPLPKD